MKFKPLGRSGVKVSELCYGTMSFGGDADEAASAAMYKAWREAATGEASLKRLQTDRVEVLFLHHYDKRTPLEESVRALEDLVRSGKVLYPALSNWSAWQTQRAVDLQEAH